MLIPITLTGAQRSDAAGTSIRAGSGSLTLMDLAQAEEHVSTDSRTVLLSLSREMIEQDGVTVRALHGRVVATARRSC